MAILQGVLFGVLFSGEMASSIARDFPVESMDAFQSFSTLFTVFIGISVVALACSIALLKRKNWARLLFIGLTGVGALFQSIGLALQLKVATLFSTAPRVEGFNEAEQLGNIMVWFVTGISAVMLGLMLWVIYKLCSKPIVREFKPINEA
ncbi:hypothetical protein GCM10007895_08170 [Paraferrimonas sedimenticola]|uniref:Uncharacterized protein n=2 Tax=Paraferrimonas sedimenticola TaxID=375674 RepID=A0AA37RUN7_9GAMM|nr:hypothetical protein GCM10007895_08170 [Paraferrimonas sedimenticola]